MSQDLETRLVIRKQIKNLAYDFDMTRCNEIKEVACR